MVFSVELAFPQGDEVHIDVAFLGEKALLNFIDLVGGGGYRTPSILVCAQLGRKKKRLLDVLFILIDAVKLHKVSNR